MVKELKQEKTIDNVDIIIDHDSLLQYERISYFRSVFNFCLVGLLGLFPAFFSKFIIKKSGKKATKVYDNVTTHVALDTLYDTGIKFRKKSNIIKEIVENVWFNLNNPRALRNRLKLVKKLLEQSINLKINEGKKNVKILSLASGSARAVIENVKEFNNVSFAVKLVDKNKNALEVSQEIIQRNGLSINDFTLINDNVRNFPNYYIDDNPDIVEMVGLLDYLDEKKCVMILSKIFNNLSPSGILVTANIRDNNEKNFLEKALKWMMVYREPDDLSRILIKAGFRPENITIIYEPLLIHGVTIAKK